MKNLIRVLAVVVIIFLIFFIYIYSGSYNISATVPHNKLTRWVIGITTDNSIKHHSKDIQVPNLNDNAMIKLGAEHYKEMCVDCHGAPGIHQDEIAKGLYPKPPMLAKTVHEWTPAELFWMTKNGIKMTGMPAWGPTHTDDKIWALVAFMEKLPAMTPEQFNKLVKDIKPDND